MEHAFKMGVGKKALGAFLSFCGYMTLRRSNAYHKGLQRRGGGNTGFEPPIDYRDSNIHT